MIRRLALVSVLLLTPVPLTSCDAVSQIFGSTAGASSTQVDVMNVAKKGLTAAHDSHRFAADLLTALATSGVVHGQTALTYRQYLDDSEKALVAGDKAVALGDAKGASDALDKANTLIAQIHALIGQ